MAYKQPKKVEKAPTVKTPSDCGSHKSMLSNEERFAPYNDKENFAKAALVVLLDERGLYISEAKNLDSGLCDYHRTANIEIRNSNFEKFIS